MMAIMMHFIYGVSFWVEIYSTFSFPFFLSGAIFFLGGWIIEVFLPLFVDVEEDKYKDKEEDKYKDFVFLLSSSAMSF